MGLGSSRITPENLMANLERWSNYATLPSSTNKASVSVPSVAPNEQNQKLVQNVEPVDTGAFMTEKDNGNTATTSRPCSSGSGIHRIDPSSDPNRVCSPAIPHLGSKSLRPPILIPPIEIHFRDECCKHQYTEINETTADSDETIITLDTLNGQLIVPRFRKWQIFPGKNRFYCNGRFMSSNEMIVFYISFVFLHLVFGLFAGFELPFLMEQVTIFMPLPTAILYAICVSTMLYSSCSDPGIIPRSTRSEIEFNQKHYPAETCPHGVARFIREQVNGKYIVRRWCPTCMLYKPPRATHCRSCNNCVERFDHHCPFLGNCVGQRNYTTFITYVTFIVISGAYITSCSVWFIYLKYLVLKDTALAFQNSIGACIAGSLSAAAFIPVFVLFWMHCRFISTETTTNEDFKRKSPDNPFDRGSGWKNFVHVLFSPRIPSLLKQREYVTKDYLESLGYSDSVKDALKKRFGDKIDSDNNQSGESLSTINVLDGYTDSKLRGSITTWGIKDQANPFSKSHSTSKDGESDGQLRDDSVVIEVHKMPFFVVGNQFDFEDLRAAGDKKKPPVGFEMDFSETAVYKIDTSLENVDVTSPPTTTTTNNSIRVSPGFKFFSVRRLKFPFMKSQFGREDELKRKPKLMLGNIDAHRTPWNSIGHPIETETMDKETVDK